MDGFLDRDKFEGLMAMAEPLQALALEAVGDEPLDLSAFDTSAMSAEEVAALVEIQRGTQATTAAVQACLLSTNLPEVALVLALATALGTVIGQANSDRSLLWEQFKQRASSTIQSVNMVQAATEGSA